MGAGRRGGPGMEAAPGRADAAERPWLAALAALPEMRPRRLAAVVAACGGARAAWGLPGPELARRAGLAGDAAQRAAAAKERLDPERLMERVARLGARLVVRGDPDYPAPLDDLEEPPAVLYCRGTLPDDWARSVAVVGTRRADVLGERWARGLGRALAAAGVAVVSGLARGIDGAAHRGCLEGGGRPVAVLGSGLDRIYPPEHGRLAEAVARAGALLSEYPPGQGPQPRHFPWRNRLIAALARVTVVVQADLGSGALITATWAAELGREVMAVPGDVDLGRSRGTNALLAAGAQVAVDAPDVLTALGWTGVAARVAAAGDSSGAGNTTAASGGASGEEELRVWRCLGRVPLTPEQVATRAGLPLDVTLAALLALEVKGLASQRAGVTYIRGE